MDYYIGIDIGSLTGKIVILNRESEILAQKVIHVKKLPVHTVNALMEDALPKVGLKDTSEITYCIGTGYGRRKIPLANETISEITCHGTGAHHILPSVRTVIDIGGQDCKIIRLDAQGNLKNFIMNEKCAAGTGRYLEIMAETLGLSLDELGPLSLKAKNPFALASKCSIYARQEVMQLISDGIKKPALAAAISKAMAERVINLTEKIGLEPDIAISGGVAKNIGVVSNMERMIGTKFKQFSVDPQIIGALGAALIAKKAYLKRTGNNP